MRARRLVFLAEELSMEAFLHELLPRWLPKGVGFEVRVFQGKEDLLRRLEARLRGYADWLPADWRLVVVVDRDDDECEELKGTLESAAAAAGLRSRTRAGGPDWRIVSRIAVEELEAWYFGDWEAVRGAFPRIDANVPQKAGFRDPDAVKGGTCEAFERFLQRKGYFTAGLRNVEAAREIGKLLDPARNRSRSFARFRDALAEAVG